MLVQKFEEKKLKTEVFFFNLKIVSTAEFICLNL